MADWNELSLKYRLLMQTYRWRRVDPSPWTPLRKPLTQARIALVTSAGLYRRDIDAAFGSREGEDLSARWLPSDVSGEQLVFGQTSQSFDRTALERDPTLAFPIARAREMVRDGRIGSLAAHHASFNGSMLSPGRFLRDTAPAVADVLMADDVDAALFVPV